MYLRDVLQVEPQVLLLRLGQAADRDLDAAPSRRCTCSEGILEHGCSQDQCADELHCSDMRLHISSANRGFRGSCSGSQVASTSSHMGHSIVASTSDNNQNYGCKHMRVLRLLRCAPADVVRGVEQVPVADVHVQALQLGHVHQEAQLLVPHRVARAVLDLCQCMPTARVTSAPFCDRCRLCELVSEEQVRDIGWKSF